MGRKAKASHGKDDEVQCSTCNAWHPEEDIVRCDECGNPACPHCVCQRCEDDDDSDLDDGTADWIDDEDE